MSTSLFHLRSATKWLWQEACVGSVNWESGIPSSLMFVLCALLCAIKKSENTVPVWKDADYYLKDANGSCVFKTKRDVASLS